jgi:L-cysteine/cystine lyase
VTDAAAFRAEFPVVLKYAYLNAGTEGPFNSFAAAAVRELLEGDLAEGRIGKPRFENAKLLAEDTRERYAEVLGAAVEEVALTSSTTGGVNTVLAGLSWKAGDEVVTSDQEHPGLLAPLRRLAVVSGVSIKVAPFASVADAVGPRTRLIACSHVSWVGGEVVDVAALRATRVPILLDAAQALGAIPLNMHKLGVDYYAGSGQKWLCGPESSGALYVRADRLDEIEPPAPGYGTTSDHDDILGSPLSPTAARLDDGFPSPLRSTWAVTTLQRFQAAGWGWVHARARDGAASLAAALVQRGLEVAPRGASTLVSWSPPLGADTDAEVTRLGAAGILVRSIPSAGLLRASVGAWTSEEDIARLVDAAVAS